MYLPKASKIVNVINRLLLSLILYCNLIKQYLLFRMAVILNRYNYSDVESLFTLIIIFTLIYNKGL